MVFDGYGSLVWGLIGLILEHFIGISLFYSLGICGWGNGGLILMASTCQVKSTQSLTSDHHLTKRTITSILIQRQEIMLNIETNNGGLYSLRKFGDEFQHLLFGFWRHRYQLAIAVRKGQRSTKHGKKLFFLLHFFNYFLTYTPKSWHPGDWRNWPIKARAVNATCDIF